MVFIILVKCFDINIRAKLGMIISSFLSSSAPFFFFFLSEFLVFFETVTPYLKIFFFP